MIEWAEAWASSNLSWGRPWTAALFWGHLKCWRQCLLSALEMLVSQLKSVSNACIILIKAFSPFSAVEMKVHGAAITLEGLFIGYLKRSGEVTCTGELFEGPDSVTSLKCFLSCLLKGPCGFQRKKYCKVNEKKLPFMASLSPCCIHYTVIRGNDLKHR